MKEQPPTPEQRTPGNHSYKTFFADDQKLMQSDEWDYKNKELAFNVEKNSIEALQDDTLSAEQKNAKYDALWLWYHHAAQIAYAKYKDIDTARAYIDKALEYGEKSDSTNQITPLLKLLLHGQFIEARKFAEDLPDNKIETKDDGTTEEIDNYEKKTALELIQQFESENIQRHKA